jgi:hypothetical protein
MEAEAEDSEKTTKATDGDVMMENKRAPLRKIAKKCQMEARAQEGTI